MTLMPRVGWKILAVVVLGSASARSAEPVDTPTLERQIMPLFKLRCVKCHGPAVRKGKLNLATPRGVARGGESGAVVIAGQTEESLLWEKISSGEMPPREPLSDAEQALLRQWIERGAAGLPRVRSGDPEGADHWAFGAASRPTCPPVRYKEQLHTPIDRFIEAALEEQGLALAIEADRRTLIRRVSLDLVGLPPAPEEIERFCNDASPDAYERMVDGFLASPHYGERWGKYWLDAAGYADSNGYFDADTDRPLAYRYRDYVVRSSNRDKPLDRFVLEQLAGDEIVGFQPDSSAPPEVIELLVATHFLRNAADGTGESDGNPDELRADRYAVLEGTTQILGSALLGLTVQCARCHDHKFEPLTQKDYYQLYAILWPAYDPTRWVKPQERSIRAPSLEELAAWDARCAEIDASIAAILRRPFFDPAAVLLQSPEDEIQAIVARRPERPGKIAWLSDLSAAPSETHILARGLYGSPGAKVEAAPPAVLADPSNQFRVCPDRSGRTSGRRLAFARWLTRRGSRPAALLARVLANRIWQYHFGAGLVPTPENLGYSGAAPSHPELLEYLAFELAEGGWRAKRLHRLIVTSAVYRQASSRSGAAARRALPTEQLLGSFPLRRLDAEAIRDAMLAVSGELDRRMGGLYVPTHRTEDGEVIAPEDAAGAHRRSLYLQQRRTQIVSVLDVFDAPSIVTNCTRRNASAMPLQSLSLLNSEFVAARARGLARLLAQLGTDEDRRIRIAFERVIGRAPAADEHAAARRFLERQPARYSGQGDARSKAWIDFCQMMLASNAFLYVE
jgi:hypothetical protein